MHEETSSHVTYLWVAETVLRRHHRPLTAKQIVTFGIDDGLFADHDISKTPQKSMQARLSMNILAKGDRSPFLRTEPGKFYLRELLEQEVGTLSESRGGSRMKEYTAIRRAPSPPSEKVLVVSREAYEGILNFQGVSLKHDSMLKQIISTGRLTYCKRTDAEINPELKQFITYTVIQQKDKILSFRRGQYNRAASFLRGARCIGFGGHVTEEDLSILTFSDRGIKANAAREISEEIRLGSSRPDINPDDLELIGILNDDSSDVGVRHVAVVLRYWAPTFSEWERPQRGEASVSQLQWIKTTDFAVDLLEFEYWSQLVLRTFYPASTRSRPSFKIVRPSAFKSLYLLCVAGSIGSGKTSTTNRLCTRAGYQQVNTGKVVAKLLGIAPVPETPRDAFQAKALELISRPNGPYFLAEAILDEASLIEGSKIVIDGVRQVETLELLRGMSSRRVAMIYIYTPPDIAYKLYTTREATTPDITLSEFMHIYNAPVESEVRLLIQDADAVVYNWFGLEDYELILEKLIAELGL